MDTRTFVLGAVSGIAASTLVYWLMNGPQDRSVREDPDQRMAVTGTDSRGASGPSNESGAIAPAVTSKGGEREPPLPPSEVDQHPELQNMPTGTPDQLTSSRRSAAETPERSGPDEGAPSGVPESWPPARADRAKESKDSSWSHYMEQTLRQYLASHPKALQFDFTSIDCRTTFCEVQAIGFDESTQPVWTQVMYDVKQQPWSEFDMSASESRENDGRPLLIGTFHRVPRQ